MTLYAALHLPGNVASFPASTALSRLLRKGIRRFRGLFDGSFLPEVPIPKFQKSPALPDEL